MALLGAASWAQSDSTLTNARATDDTLMYEDAEISVPRKNAIYYFGSPFCEHFAEMKLALGYKGGAGVGVTYAYVPEVWGANATFISTSPGIAFLGGCNYRLSKPWTQFDWQAYGDIGFCYNRQSTNSSHFSPAMEAGIRCAGTNDSKFCYTSGSVGILTDFQNVYFTCGVSISLTLFVSAFILLGYYN